MSSVESKLRASMPVSWLSPVELSTLENYVQEIRSMYGSRIHQIILFGSRVRGEGNEESDIDVAVIITAEDPLLRRQIYDIATELWLKSEIKISPLVFSAEEYQLYLKMGRRIVVTIRDEGISLLHRKR